MVGTDICKPRGSREANTRGGQASHPQAHSRPCPGPRDVRSPSRALWPSALWGGHDTKWPPCVVFWSEWELDKSGAFQPPFHGLCPGTQGVCSMEGERGRGRPPTNNPLSTPTLFLVSSPVPQNQGMRPLFPGTPGPHVSCRTRLPELPWAPAQHGAWPAHRGYQPGCPFTPRHGIPRQWVAAHGASLNRSTHHKGIAVLGQQILNV